MTNREAIEVIKLAQAQVEWEYPMDYAVAFDMAISALQAQEFDTVSRQAAIDALGEEPEVWTGKDEYAQGLNNQWHYDVNALKALPSAQPEIIRCKDCKYQDENWRRVSVRWLPCMDVRTGSNWYCGSAERGEQHG